jgi:16S rRNA (guanine966-N2)-methyltransferase
VNGLRVIAGQCKGRRLLPVPGQSTRPTSDKVKESIFNIIGPFFDGGSVLDAYAGTGALAIEALSRGMTAATCIDIEPKSLKVIRQNIAACGFESACQVFRNDAKKAIPLLAKRNLKYDLVFLDPPYRYDVIPELILLLQQHDVLTDHATIVAEHDASVELDPAIGNCEQFRHAVYGDTAVTFYNTISK